MHVHAAQTATFSDRRIRRKTNSLGHRQPVNKVQILVTHKSNIEHNLPLRSYSFIYFFLRPQDLHLEPVHHIPDLQDIKQLKHSLDLNNSGHKLPAFFGQWRQCKGPIIEPIYDNCSFFRTQVLKLQ